MTIQNKSRQLGHKQHRWALVRSTRSHDSTGHQVWSGMVLGTMWFSLKRVWVMEGRIGAQVQRDKVKWPVWRSTGQSTPEKIFLPSTLHLLTLLKAFYLLVLHLFQVLLYSILSSGKIQRFNKSLLSLLPVLALLILLLSLKHHVCVCVGVCERERERWGEREMERGRLGEMERERVG